MHDTFQVVGFAAIFLTVIVGILFNDKRFDAITARRDIGLKCLKKSSPKDPTSSALYS